MSLLDCFGLAAKERTAVLRRRHRHIPNVRHTPLPLHLRSHLLKEHSILSLPKNPRHMLIWCARTIGQGPPSGRPDDTVLDTSVSLSPFTSRYRARHSEIRSSRHSAPAPLIFCSARPHYFQYGMPSRRLYSTYSDVKERARLRADFPRGPLADCADLAIFFDPWCCFGSMRHSPSRSYPSTTQFWCANVPTGPIFAEHLSGGANVETRYFRRNRRGSAGSWRR